MTAFAEFELHHISGFCFFQDDGEDGSFEPLPPMRATNKDTESKNIRIVYVESCEDDFESLDEGQKDALLEDRGLVVHRLVNQCVSDDAKNLIRPLSVQTPPFQAKAIAGLPPTPSLMTYHTIYRPDPRWPLAPPNSLCLECGKGPQQPSGELEEPYLAAQG